MTRTLRIGTRGSPLALAQAGIVRDRLISIGGIAADAIEIVIIRTSGDRIQDRSLADIGGKGLFTKEIEEALIEQRVDLAVHSLKDLPAWMPPGLGLAAVLPREDPRDTLVASFAQSIADLPAGARIGTSSPRRRALLLHLRPDLEIVEFRGNVGTRLAKLDAAQVDGTLLAVAGMRRLGINRAHHPIDPEEMLPAACQGAIGIEIRVDDDETAVACAAIGDESTSIAIRAERAFLAELGGSCRSPVAALATVRGGEVGLDALVASPEGAVVIRRREGAISADAARLGVEVARAVRSALPAGVRSAIGLER
jgi:hydroxymethylbilane synthase